MRLPMMLKRVAETAGCFLRRTHQSSYHLFRLPEVILASQFCERWDQDQPANPTGVCTDDSANPLKSYVDDHSEGLGIYRWTHYLDIYHRHFQKFVGRDVHVVEVGVYGGGSLQMWRSYFGPRCRISGVDINEACRMYEGNQINIFIGDQADRQFWRAFRQQVPPVDVLIDDGGHMPEQQMATLEEMLPCLRPGGVYLCEDIHRIGNRFAAYASSLAENLNAWVPVRDEKQTASSPTRFQAAIRSVHVYPFVVVIEKAESPINQFVAPQHGTEWPSW